MENERELIKEIINKGNVTRIKIKKESQSTDYLIAKLRKYHNGLARIENRQSSIYKSNSILNVKNHLRD